MVAVCAVFCSAVHNWRATYMKDTTGASAATASYAANAPSMTVARLAGDLAVRRLGPIRSIRIGGAMNIPAARWWRSLEVSCRPLPGSR